VLLISGHPALEGAAAGVLEAGDVGRTYLAWPGSAGPRADDLEARAREWFNVEHGRIDSAGQPRRAYLPLLRMGAMVHYLAARLGVSPEDLEAHSAPAVPEEVRRLLADGRKVEAIKVHRESTGASLQRPGAPSLGSRRPHARNRRASGSRAEDQGRR